MGKLLQTVCTLQFAWCNGQYQHKAGKVVNEEVWRVERFGPPVGNGSLARNPQPFCQLAINTMVLFFIRGKSI